MLVEATCDVKQVLKALGISRNTLKKYIREGKFPQPGQLGGKYFFRVTEVNNFIRNIKKG
jgi:predicted DNA-binding transcriptional regulator AlpA